jgi:hypothetical protein
VKVVFNKIDFDCQVTFDPLFHTMSLEQILYIFECVLLEKKLIVCAKHLDTLTACVNAISALVYPFYWQVRSHCQMKF